MGILLIQKALAAGHIVTIYARSPSKLPEGKFDLRGLFCLQKMILCVRDILA